MNLAIQLSRRSRSAGAYNFILLRASYATSAVKPEPILKDIGLRMDIKNWQSKHKIEIKKFLKENKVAETLDYFYQEVKVPDKPIFSLILAEVGKTGHTKLAFKLFKDMRSRDIRPSAAILTCMFNSCAMNTEDKQMALRKAHDLYEQIKIRGWPCTTITYHSMMKAFAYLGDVESCFKLIDEMTASKQAVTVETYQHLMSGCVGSKDTGFVLAMRVMRLMLYRRIKPNKECYYLLIEAASKCGCGSNAEVLNKLLSDTKRTQLKDSELNLITDGRNLLDVRVDEKIVSVSCVPVTVADKMILIGGIDGVLLQMEYFNIQPDSKTFSLLLETISSKEEFEKFLEKIPKKNLDIGFWNQLLKKSIYNKYLPVAEIREMIDKRGTPYDIFTYGIFALGANTREKCFVLLRELEEKNIQANTVIMSTLISNMSWRFETIAVITLLKVCIREQIPLNPQAINALAKMMEKCFRREEISTIESLLKRIDTLGENFYGNRLKQFEPKVAKRDRRRWDPEADESESNYEEESHERSSSDVAIRYRRKIQ